jgi:hypothetical protein
MLYRTSCSESAVMPWQSQLSRVRFLTPVQMQVWRSVCRCHRILSAADVPEFAAHVAAVSSTATAAAATGPAAGSALARLRAIIKQHSRQHSQQQQQQQLSAALAECQDLSASQEQLRVQRRSALQQQLDASVQIAALLPQRYRGVLLLRLPVKPPTRVQTDVWLAAESAKQGSRKGLSRVWAKGIVTPYGSAAAAAAGLAQGAAAADAAVAATAAAAATSSKGAQSGPDFVMHANTGKLIPVMPAAAKAAGRTSGTPAGGLAALAAVTPLGAAARTTAAAADSQADYADGELALVATPNLLLSLPSQREVDEGKAEAAAAAGLGSKPNADHTPAAAAAAADEAAHGESNSQEGDEDDDFEAPASPKYDERSFFFSATGRTGGSNSSRVKPRKMRSRAAEQQQQQQQQQQLIMQGTPRQAVDLTPADAAAATATAAEADDTAAAVTPPPPSAAAAAATALDTAGRVSGMGTVATALPRSPGMLTVGTATVASLRLPGRSEHITPPAVPGSSGDASADGKTTAGGKTAAGRTPPSQLGFKRRVRGGAGSKAVQRPELSIVAVEVHADSRGSLLPDPR